MAKDLTAIWAAMSEAAGTSSRKDTQLPPAPQLPTIPSKTGSALPTAGGSGGGLASPLTEVSYANRQFHPVETLTSSDGIFTLKIQRIKQIGMKDSNQADAVFIYKPKP